MQFGKVGKLSLCFFGPFKIIEKMGEVAYWLALPSKLVRVHNIFHVSLLSIYILDSSYILESEPLVTE